MQYVCMQEISFFYNWTLKFTPPPPKNELKAKAYIYMQSAMIDPFWRTRHHQVLCVTPVWNHWCDDYL